MSDDIHIGELAEIMKFKLNVKITDPNQRLTSKQKIVFFNQQVSISEAVDVRELYEDKREQDGWLYLDFIINEIKNNP